MNNLSRIINGYFISVFVLGMPIGYLFMIAMAIEANDILWLCFTIFCLPFVLGISILFAWMAGE